MATYRLPSKKVSATSHTRFNLRHESMLRNVVNFCLAVPTNIGVTQSLPLLYQLVQLIQTNLNTISTLRFVIDMPITGYSQTKKITKNALIDVTVPIMSATRSYGISIQDNVLSAQMTISASALHAMSYLKMLQYVGGALQIVTPLATAGTLSSVGVTAGVVTAWQALWDQLNLIFSDPQKAIQQRIGLNHQVYTLLHDCMFTVSNECDELVRTFRTGNPDYFGGYCNARKVMNHPVHTQLRAWIADDLNQPISGCKVSILGTNVFGYTDRNGYVLLEGFGFGSHQVVVDTDAQPYTFGPFDFKKGESQTQHFTVSVFAQPAKTSTARVVKK